MTKPKRCSAQKRPLLVGTISFMLLACGTAPVPLPVTQAEAVADSKASEEAKQFAPQAFAKAEKLRAEALFLHDDGRPEESAAAGEQAIAAYTEAFALSRVAKAEERLEAAKADYNTAQDNADALDRVQLQVAADADAFEMRARVYLDTEEVKDPKKISPERARARRQAAKRLAAEAGLLCLSTSLLNGKAQGLVETQATVHQLDIDLLKGSARSDLYPRAAAARADCLKQLSLARRPVVQKAPQSSASDKLLKELTETGKVFAYRDDRGIVVNLGSPLDENGSLTVRASELLHLLGGTARNHPAFPLLLVAHSASKGHDERANDLLKAASDVLQQIGAKKVAVHSVGNAQPLVNTRVRGAAEKNERLEVVFISPGR